MAKKVEVNQEIRDQMQDEWEIEVSSQPFLDEKGARLPSFGYPCGVCASKSTVSRFARSTEEEESQLAWMELQCKECQNYTKYTRK